MTENTKTILGLGALSAVLAWLFYDGEKDSEQKTIDTTAEVVEEPKTLSGVSEIIYLKDFTDYAFKEAVNRNEPGHTYSDELINKAVKAQVKKNLRYNTKTGKTSDTSGVIQNYSYKNDIPVYTNPEDAVKWELVSHVRNSASRLSRGYLAGKKSKKGKLSGKKRKKLSGKQLDTSWISGKYVVRNQKVEINTKLPYIGIEGNRIDFFQQGDEAEQTIKEIHQHWVKNDESVEDAINWFMETYLL